MVVEDILYNPLRDDITSIRPQTVRHRGGDIFCFRLAQFNDVDGSTDDAGDVKKKTNLFLMGNLGLLSWDDSENCLLVC
jgi:hypothetical protein